MKKIILAIAVIFLVSGSHVQAEDVNLQNLIQETQRMEQGPNAFRLVWWIPTEYWMAAFKNAPNMTDQQKQVFYRTVDEYNVLAVIDAKVSDLGSILPQPRNTIVSNLSLVIGDEKILKPLSDTQISSDAKNLFAMMKPAIANMLGQFGQGMEFICFTNAGSNGQRILDPKKNNRLSAKLGNSSFNWRLPLGSLMPGKYDKNTGETFPGNYIYNPFTGDKLIMK